VGGLATCLCLDLAPGGSLTIANAGHLPPYRDQHELDCTGGLPLGIIAATSYPESNFTLAGGDTLTVLSDGVVEARSAFGELFGFDRTRDLSAEPAEKIAQTAQAFGQEDDITVLKLKLE
jgi:serine phosphatase RsbU (regulator of sigma subunit)